MTDINPGVDLSILAKANEAQDAYITNPNMKTADAYIQALQETTMTLIDSILMLAGPKFRELKYLGCPQALMPPEPATTNCPLLSASSCTLLICP